MYDNYIALDWAQKNMAIACMTKFSNKASVVDVPADLEELKAYLKSKKGRSIFTIEETNTSQWLYAELHGLVEKIVICDPYRNKLLSEGAKNDKIDAIKLATLLRSNLIKPVYHSLDQIVELRKIISGYRDVVQAGVRCKNQRSALLRSSGMKKSETIKKSAGKFVFDGLSNAIEAYEKEKKRYEDCFKEYLKTSQQIKHLKTIPGIGLIGAVTIAAIVVDANRFKSHGHFYSYCGLVRHSKDSGGKSYGKKKPRYRRELKSAFKIAALSAISMDGPLREYYFYLIKEKNYADYNARNAVARKIASAVLGVMKSGKRYNKDKIGALKELSK